MLETKNVEEKSVIFNKENGNTYTPYEMKHYQMTVEDALKMDVIDLFQDEDIQGHRILSRADLILVFTLYKGGLEQFLDDYKEYVRTMQKERGFRFVNKPHHYLKNLLG